MLPGDSTPHCSPPLSRAQVLLCCSDDGTVYPYSVSGELQPWQFSFGAQVQSLGVAEAVVWPTGVLVVCRNNEMYAVTDFAQPMPFRLRDLPPELSERHCIAVVEPHLTANGGLEVLVAAGDTVWSVSADSVIDHGLTFGRVVSMAVSPNGAREKKISCFPLFPVSSLSSVTRFRSSRRYALASRTDTPPPAAAPHRRIACVFTAGLLVALFSEDGKLWVLSADMQKNLTEFATRAKVPSVVDWMMRFSFRTIPRLFLTYSSPTALRAAKQPLALKPHARAISPACCRSLTRARARALSPSYRLHRSSWRGAAPTALC